MTDFETHPVGTQKRLDAMDDLLDSLKLARQVIKVACGETSPYIKHVYSIIDPAIDRAEVMK